MMSRKNNPPSFGKRLNTALGPIAAGILLDLLDLATFGPVGAAAGWWMACALGVEKETRKWFALGAAIYCTIPFTELDSAGHTDRCVRPLQTKRTNIRSGHIRIT